MKTSLDNQQLLEDCLLGQATGTQQALLQAKLLLDPELRDEVYWQRRTYAIIREYGRMQFRNELDLLHQALFAAPEHRSFRDRVLGFFRK